MSSKSNSPRGDSPHRLDADDLRWHCDPACFAFETTADITECPIHIIGQARAQKALDLGMSVRSDGYNIFVAGDVGSGRSTVVRRMMAGLEGVGDPPDDLVYVHNFENPDQPNKVIFPAGKGHDFRRTMCELIESLGRDLPKLFDSEDYRSHRMAMLEQAGKEQKRQIKGFEERTRQQGFVLVQVQIGPLTRPQLVPLVAGNPMELDDVEKLVEQDQFRREDFEALQERLPQLRAELDGLGKQFRNLDRELRRHLHKLDRDLARPLIDEALGELREAFAVEGVAPFLDQAAEDLLEHLDDFREGDAGPGGQPAESPDGATRYQVNVIVDNSKTRGRPIVWETSPNYRNLFGTVERVRTDDGEWVSDHMRIRAGSLLEAHGGVLVINAMDLLVEPGVWAALKRTLRNHVLDIQSYDPLHLLSSISLKPEPIPIDVKVVLIGTRHIYNALFRLDEDFKKIFKIKAEFAMHTPLSDAELQNYACFVHKKITDDGLTHFHRDAVAAIVEHGVRLSGHYKKLTTRFTEIADLVRESSYWAGREDASVVTDLHVERALKEKRNRFDLYEELLRERIAEGMVLVDLEGAKVGQVNGLAVLDQGDHRFGQPSRITATTAMGRAGIIDLDREAEMSGAIHTKGVLILSGFLRSVFAQDRPLTLTASLSFEQNYGGVDGDSASSAELYALLSSLADVPIDQGIAVTGSVNQRGEIQPIGGVNDKIEGFFELCKLKGLDGRQGVMIPHRNRPHLMLTREVVSHVREGKFHIWCVDDIAAGLQVLTGVASGRRGEDGSYPPDSVFGRADARLQRLAEQVRRFGLADTDR